MKSEIYKTLEGAVGHIEDDDPQPTQVLVTPGNITMSMPSVDDLLQWCDTIQTFFDDGGFKQRVTFIAQQLWKQAENEPAPTVITAQYNWDFDDNNNDDMHQFDTTVRVFASSPITMDQLADLAVDDRIEVTRSQVETLMLQGHATKAGIAFGSP